jgi:Carboxypeptidase regulatory-like domain
MKTRWIWLVTCLLFVGPAYAQLDRGTISGTVLDPSGGAIPGATVTITAAGTNVSYTVETNEHGQYNMPNLPIGAYSIKYEASGFKVLLRENLTLQISQVLRIDVRMEVGIAADVVNVTAQAPLVQTDTPEVGTTVTRSYIFDLPLSFAGGRQPENFAYRLTPGVEGGTWTSRINGSPAFSKEVLLDGATVTTYLAGHFGESSVSMEALEEFKIQTSGLSAEYGRTGGGVFNFVMRSGQNSPHGSLFGQLRNEALNANSFANNAANIPRARERRFNFGGSFGGPIVIPKVYNGRDKTFFFVALEKYRERQLAFGTPNRTVPQLEMYDGNLSQLLTSTVVGTDALGRMMFRGAIYDPLTLRQVDGRFVADAFPGNIIPANRISAVSKRIGEIAKKHYAPLSSALTANSQFPLANTPEFDQNQWSFKIDHNVSIQQKLSGSLARNSRPRLLLDQGGVWDPNDPIGGPLSTARRQVVNSWLARISHDFTLSTAVLNHVMVNFNRMGNPNRSAHVDEGCAAALGINGVKQDGPCPRINWGTGPAGISFDQLGDPQDDFQAYNGWGITDSMSWSKGRHFLKFGIDLRGNQQNNQPQGNLSGTFNFNAAQTGIPGVNFVGHSFASFLLGEVNNASVGVPLVSGGRTYYYAGFVHDDFKLSRKWTLNVGLRYEFQPPMTEVADRTSNFDLEVTDPLTGMKGAVVFAGDGAGRIGRSTFVESDKNNFSPRVGFAYSPDGKTSVRSGYGIFYSAVVFNGFSGAPFQRGFAGTNNMNNSLNYTSLFNWDGGYPGNFVAAQFDPSSWRAGGVTHWDPQAGRGPYTQQWNLNIQRELITNLTVDVGYVGTKSSGLLAANDVAQKNQLDAKYLKFGADLVSILRTDADAQRFGLSGLPYPAFTGQLWQALVPYPHLASNGIGLTTFNAPLGHSTYHSLQLVVNRRSSNGLNLNWNYTFSKTIQNMESTLRGDNAARPLDYYNLRLEKSLADNDLTHTFKMGLNYDLPFGRGRQLLTNMNRALEFVLGGWTLSFVGDYYSGTPLRFTGSGIPGWNGRANRADLNNPSGDSLLSGFDPSKFDASAVSTSGYEDHRYIRAGVFSDHKSFTLGTAGFTSNVRDPWSIAEDFGFRKRFFIREDVGVEIRAELLNVFNRHFFGGIITDVLNPRFGQITTVTGNRTGQIGLRFDF